MKTTRIIRRYPVTAMLIVAALSTGLAASGCGLLREGEAYVWGMESYALPTRSGQFNLTLRSSFPKETAYDGSAKVPPVRNVQ
jgi:hypothetical protein